MDDQVGATPPAPQDPVSTRDWAWGLAVVVGGTFLVIALAIWWLSTAVSCGTRPAPGYEDAGGANRSCQSIDARPLLAGLAPERYEPAPP